MPGRRFLLVSTPANVPDCVFHAMHGTMEDHGSIEVPRVDKLLFANLKKVFRTE